jgi:hypothetical protein
LREIHEWIVFETIEAADEREAYENAGKNVEPSEPIDDE